MFLVTKLSKSQYYLEPSLYYSITDIVEAMNTPIQKKHTETSITVKGSRKTQKVEIHLVKEGSGLAFSSMEVGHNFRCIGCNDSGVLLRGKGPHKPEFAHDIVRIHSLMIYADLIEYKTIGDTEAPLLRCFPVIWKLKAGVTITTGQCMSYQTFSNLQFTWLLESSFHSIQINLRDERRKIHFVSVGTTRLVLMFKKASKIHFQLKRRYKMVASRQVEIPFNRGIGRQRGRGFEVLAQVIGRTASPFLRKYVVPAAKLVGADLVEFAAPETAEVVRGRRSWRRWQRVWEGKPWENGWVVGKPRSDFNKNFQASRSRRDIFSNAAR